MGKYENGFGAVGGLIVLVVVGLVAITGLYVYLSNHKTTNNSTSATRAVGNQPPTSKNTQSSNNSEKFLVIKELDIRFPLTANTADAYYNTGARLDPNTPPFVFLSVHSLDQFPQCSASGFNQGVATIEAHNKIEQYVVTGKLAADYPHAPLIGNNYYIITRGQYDDCTQGKAHDLYQSVVSDFVNAYSKIERD